MATNWTALKEYLQQKAGPSRERVLLTLDEVQRVLADQPVPEAIHRAMSWDPALGKRAGGLQNVLNEVRFVPVAVEWDGGLGARPRLRWVILQLWGTGLGE